jgi:hypothetical protein
MIRKTLKQDEGPVPYNLLYYFNFLLNIIISKYRQIPNAYQYLL